MKFNIKKLLIILTIIMFGSFLIAASIYFAMGGKASVLINAGQVRTLKEFPVKDIKEILINTVNTDINIIPAADTNVKVEFYGNLTTNMLSKAPELYAHQENGILDVSVDNPSAANPDFRNVSPLTLDIYLPQGFSNSINIETISGTLKMGNINLESFNFKSLSGPLQANTVAASHISIQTTSGKVDLNNAEGNIDISSLSGEVNLSMKSFKEDLNIKTISGLVKVTLPGKSGFDFSLSSVSGRIENEFGAQIRFADGRKIEGTVGQGASNLTVGSTSGNIKVQKGQ